MMTVIDQFSFLSLYVIIDTVLLMVAGIEDYLPGIALSKASKSLATKYNNNIIRNVG